MGVIETDADTLHLLADVAASFAKADPARVRRLRDAGGATDRDAWRQIADNGWLGILVGEELDGAGLGLDAATMVAERLGYGGFPEPFVACGVLAPLVLAAAGSTDLGAVLAGETLVGVATEADVTAGAGGLNGYGRFFGVGDADAYVVAVGDALHWIDAAAAAVIAEPRADGTLTAYLELDGAASRVLMSDGGAEVLATALDTARIVAAAELLGLMNRVLDMTVEYLGQRKQFGRPIGAFQALQHRVVDAWMQRELARAALSAAVDVHLNPSSTATQRAAAASSAKARAAHAAPALCRDALQLHGAIGFTDEYDLGLYLNRALALAPWLGNASVHRRRYAELTDQMEATG